MLYQNHCRLLCPEFNCKEEVDFTTVIQILNISEVWKYLTRKRENLIHKQRKYCPNEKYWRLLSSMTSDKRTNAVCGCGTKFCMDCFQSPCWPAPCEVSQKYWDAVKTKGVDISKTEEDFTTSVPEIVIQGKLCPNCNRFTEKDGGCCFVYCVCGVGFCWGVGECLGNTTPELNSVTKIAMANYSERRQNVYYLTNTWKRI